jgi:hypothetical protein
MFFEGGVGVHKRGGGVKKFHEVPFTTILWDLKKNILPLNG